MVTKAGKRREQRENAALIRNLVLAAGSIVVGLLLFVLPRTELWIGSVLTLAFSIALYPIWHCLSFQETWLRRIAGLIGMVVLFTFIGLGVWPHIKVSPTRVTFVGFPNETFNFSVRNGTDDDVYDVQIPFPIGHSKHFEDKFSAKVFPNGDPVQRLSVVYNYCFGVSGDGNVRHVMPNEREVLIVHVPHLSPAASANFTISYTGGEKVETQAGEPSFSPAPTSYSYTQGTFGVRGDYRICKYAGTTDGGMAQ